MSKWLTVEQETVINGILTGMTQKAAAESAGVAPETVSRWLAEPFGEFGTELDNRRRALRMSTAIHLVRLATRAAAELESALDSENEAVRFKAAVTILKAAGVLG